MRVSRGQLHRALLIGHGLIRGALRRGYDVESFQKESYYAHAGVAIVIGEHKYPFEFREETRTLAFTQAEIDAWRKQITWRVEDRSDALPPPQLKRKEPTGKLVLVMPNGYRGGRATWTDGARSLNGHLDYVFRALEERVIEDELAAAEARERLAALARAEAARGEQDRLNRIDDARASRALAEAKAWREAQRLRAYADALRERLPELDEAERERIAGWCDWLDDRIRRSDPTRSTQLIRGIDDERDGRG